MGDGLIRDKAYRDMATLAREYMALENPATKVLIAKKSVAPSATEVAAVKQLIAKHGKRKLISAIKEFGMTLRKLKCK